MRGDASLNEFRDLARAMGWQLNVHAMVCLTRPGYRSIQIHHIGDRSVVKALTMAAEAAPEFTTSQIRRGMGHPPSAPASSPH